MNLVGVLFDGILMMMKVYQEEYHHWPPNGYRRTLSLPSWDLLMASWKAQCLQMASHKAQCLQMGQLCPLMLTAGCSWWLGWLGYTKVLPGLWQYNHGVQLYSQLAVHCCTPPVQDLIISKGQCTSWDQIRYGRCWIKVSVWMCPSITYCDNINTGWCSATQHPLSHSLSVSRV